MTTKQKLELTWIGKGKRRYTHIIPRLKKVIDGEDPGGVTEADGTKCRIVDIKP